MIFVTMSYVQYVTILCSICYYVLCVTMSYVQYVTMSVCYYVCSLCYYV